MAQPQQPPKPIAQTKIKMKDVITLTARLAQVLAEEVDLLSAMKVPKIEALQREKIFLTNALETQRRLIDKHPNLVETIPSQDKEDMKKVVDVFNNILEENHRRLLVAKEINHKIVQAITDVVKKSTLSRVYDVHGLTGPAPYETLSVTLNKRV